jgi:hypothetical protein
MTPGVARHERPPEPISACDLLVGQSIAGRLRVRNYSCALRPPQLASCPAYIRILPGVVMGSLPSISTM